MPSYISLINWTEKGIGAYKDTVDRAEAGQNLAKKHGGSFDIYWTVGVYDLIAISTFPDDESATAFALELGSLGNVRTNTLRAHTADEMRAIIAKTR